MDQIDLQGGRSDAALVDLELIGPLRARTRDSENILPSLRKGAAILVVLALSEGQAVSRRQLAGLLWSRSETAQGLARLRDALHTLRQRMREALGGTDLLQLSGDRVALLPGAIRIDIEQPGCHAARHASEVAADLDGIDPALDEWLAAFRARLREREPEPRPEPQAGSVPKRGSVIGVGLLNAIGMRPDHDLSLALAEEIATALARVRGLIVISSASVAAGLAFGRNLREELGLDFLLEGTLQHVGERLRITVKLVDAAAGVVCWTSHFEYDHDNLFAVQQDVAGLIAAGLEPEIPVIEVERMKRLGGMGEGVYGLVLRAISRIHLLERRSFMEAGELLNRAIAKEPEYSPAYSCQWRRKARI